MPYKYFSRALNPLKNKIYQKRSLAKAINHIRENQLLLI